VMGAQTWSWPVAKPRINSEIIWQPDVYWPGHLIDISIVVHRVLFWLSLPDELSTAKKLTSKEDNHVAF
jgi:hypothetical protein